MEKHSKIKTSSELMEFITDEKVFRNRWIYLWFAKTKINKTRIDINYSNKYDQKKIIYSTVGKPANLIKPKNNLTNKCFLI